MHPFKKQPHDLFPRNHAIGKLAHEVETSDAAKPIYGTVGLTRTNLRLAEHGLWEARLAEQGLPLGQGCRAEVLVGGAIDEVALRVGVVVDVAIERGELL